MVSVVHNDISLLRKACLDYLKDAGFTFDMFEMKEDYDRECLQLEFETEEAVLYIMKDIKKTKWKNEIKIIKRLNRATFYKIK